MSIEIIEESETSLKLFDNISKRYFLLNYPKIIRGIKSLNVKQILHNRILIKDFAYNLTPFSLNLKFEFVYENKHTFYDIECDEIFVESLNIEDDDITNEQYKEYIYSLINQVNNLNSRILLLEEKVLLLED